MFTVALNSFSKDRGGKIKPEKTERERKGFLATPTVFLYGDKTSKTSNSNSSSNSSSYSSNSSNSNKKGEVRLYIATRYTM